MGTHQSRGESLGSRHIYLQSQHGCPRLTTVKELSGDSQGEMGVSCLLVGKVSAELSRRGWGEFANLESVMELAFCF